MWVGLGGQSGCERRIENFLKIQKKKFRGGGGGSVGGSGEGSVFVKIQKKKNFFWGGVGVGGRGRVGGGGGSGWM